jgi:Fe(3+) dicitrate transport protein
MNSRFPLRPLCAGIALALFLPPLSATAAEEATGEQSEILVKLPAIDVVGQEEGDVAKQPGSVDIVTAEEIKLSQPKSTEEALRNVPGIVIKPEEESAIVANIGMRGLSAADYKTLILEDGVPVAPGLFVGNARYYNPRIQHIDSIEVLKGAASLRYGPSTIGGVINYISKTPEEGVAVAVRGGSFNTKEVSAELGGTSRNNDAVFGAVITQTTSDGFMDKGYEMSDIIVKSGLAIADNQWVGVKFSHYENDANISYRGQHLNEFERGDDHNPAPDDYFLTGRQGFDLNHEWELSDNLRLNTLLFWSETYRDYWRYGVNSAASQAAGTWVYTDTVQGNNRAFERIGADTRLQINHGLFGIQNEAEIGLRYMTEEMHDQTISATRATPRSGTISQDRIDSAESLALYLQNRFELTESLAVTPGVRMEKYEQKRENLRAATGNEADTANTEVLPGVGATFQIVPQMQLFGGVYEAFSPALNNEALTGPGSTLDDQNLEAERSTNVEIGIRGGDHNFSYELAAFHMDFDNQIIPANSNPDFQNTNGGKTLHQGIEFGAGGELGAGFRLDTNATWVPVARFEDDRFDASNVQTAEKGNRVPYTPKWVANATLSHTWNELRTSLSAHYTGDQYTDPANTTPITEFYGNQMWVGEIEAYTIYNLNALYNVTKELEVYGTVKNLADKHYIASLRQGIYVGTERSFDVGFRYQF